MLKSAFATLLLVASSANVLAEWTIETGRKGFSSFPPVIGALATTPAKSPLRGVTARLQIECFTHPQLTGLTFGIVLSKAPPNGGMAWRYKYDEALEVQRGPFSRLLPPNAISLGDGSSGELKGLRTARRLRLTLVPASGPELTYDFDVSGASNAIRKIPCKESAAL
jgi:hypothetical protein